MAEFELEEAGPARRNGADPVVALTQVGTSAPPSQLPQRPPQCLPTFSQDERKVLSGYAAELDTYYAGMATFEGMEPDEVMARLAAMVARLTEIRARLHRLGTTRATQLRTKEIDPLLDSLRILFQIHSRLLSSRQMEWDMARGASS